MTRTQMVCNPAACLFVFSIATLRLAAVSSAGESVVLYMQHKNIVYAESDGIGLLMDVFTPNGQANGLAIVDIASGGMHSDRGKLDDHKKAGLFDVFCGKGYTVFALRPGSTPKFSGPEMLDHIGKGVAWIVEHAKEYKIDPDRLGLTGASSGGYLACMTAVSADRNAPATNIKAVGVFFPVTDLHSVGGLQIDARAGTPFGEAIRQLLFPQGVDGLDDEAIRARINEYSPVQHVTSKAPPFLFIHGDADFLVPLEQSEVMVAALKKVGVPAELIVKKGGGHRWPTISEEVQVMADWFDTKLSSRAASK